MDKLTIIKALLSEEAATPQNASESAYKIGANYQFRMVTFIVTGKLLRICHDGLVITDAAWIADTGRFADAVVSGEYDEVEPYPDGAEVIINWQAMSDACKIEKLPRKQK